MKLRRLLLLGQFPLWVTLALAYMLLSQTLNARVHATTQATQIRIQSAGLAQTLQTMTDMETGVRGYVVAGREEFLEPYHRGVDKLPSQLSRLRTLAARLPDPELAQRDLERIDSLARRWINEVAQPEIAVRRRGDSARARELVSTGQGKRLVDALRQRVHIYEAREQARLTEQESVARTQLSRLRRNLLLMGTAFLLVSILATAALSGLLSRAFRHLGQAVQELGAGAEQVKLKDSGIEELRSLSSEFNRMSQQLSQAQKDVGQHAGDLARRNVQMRALGELSDWLQAARSMEEAAQVLGRALPALLPHTCGTLLLHNASRNLILPLTTWGDAPDTPPNTPEHCWALRRGEARFPGEGRFAPPCLEGDGPEPQQRHSYVCFPLFSHGETLGILRVYPQPSVDAPESLLSDREELRQLLVPLTRQISLALSALRLQERLLQQSLRDPLTGLANRRHLEQELEVQIAQAARSGKPLAFVAVDVDHFKRLNDTFGHDAGDAVLVRLGAALRDLTPAGSLAARPGGEEFALLLPGHDLAAAQVVAERLRREVEGWTLSHTGILLGQITVSQGLALWEGAAQSSAALVKQADEALYASKTAGRNRVTLAPPSIQPTRTVT